MRRVAAAAAAVALVAACATAPPPAATPPVVQPGPDLAFVLDGRLSARKGAEGFAGSFVWRHVPGDDDVALNSPLGQTVARLSGATGRVRIRLAAGGELEAADWEALTARALNVPLPVAGLAWWLRGVPHPGSAFTTESDGAGRAQVLRQDGWEIVYTYGGDGEALPTRVRLAYTDVDVRFALDHWQ